MVDHEIIRKARQTNLVDYLTSRDVPLTRNGSRYRHRDHDSLVFTESAYFWNSRNEHGNAIDYLTRYLDMTFNEAVEALTSDILCVSESRPRPSAPTVTDLDINTDSKRVIAYLNKTRRVNYAVIKNLLDTKHLYQETATNNAIFPIYDECGGCVGAEIEGTLSDIRFKGTMKDSKYGYGFNVRYSKDNTYDYALFFESAVDLISFIDLKTNHERKTLEKCILVSMAGLKMSVIKKTLKMYEARTKQIKTVICIDNDQAAENFISTLNEKNIMFVDRRPDRKYKDWNEQLVSLKAT